MEESLLKIFLGVVHGSWTSAGEGSSITFESLANGLLYVIDWANGNYYFHAISNGALKEISKGDLTVQLRIERVDATHFSITRTSSSSAAVFLLFLKCR